MSKFKIVTLYFKATIYIHSHCVLSCLWDFIDIYMYGSVLYNVTLKSLIYSIVLHLYLGSHCYLHVKISFRSLYSNTKFICVLLKFILYWNWLNNDRNLIDIYFQVYKGMLIDVSFSTISKNGHMLDYIF